MENKFYLQSHIKSVGTAYLFFLLFGSHYAYLVQWSKQILFWITLGGVRLWALYDLFTMQTKVNDFNRVITDKLQALDNEDKIQMMEAIRKSSFP